MYIELFQHSLICSETVLLYLYMWIQVYFNIFLYSPLSNQYSDKSSWSSIDNIRCVSSKPSLSNFSIDVILEEGKTLMAASWEWLHQYLDCSGQLNGMIWPLPLYHLVVMSYNRFPLFLLMVHSTGLPPRNFDGTLCNSQEDLTFKQLFTDCDGRSILPSAEVTWNHSALGAAGIKWLHVECPCTYPGIHVRFCGCAFFLFVQIVV